MVEFTQDNAIRALRDADPILRAADVLGVWLDMDGSGWTEDYKIIIDTTQKHGRDTPILAGADVGETVWLAEVPPISQQAVSKALAGLDIGDRLVLTYMPRERFATGQKIWPITHLVSDLRQRITELEAEIARLENL